MLTLHRFTSFVRNNIERLARDQRGVSAVEFALLLPLMLTLYLGAVETSSAVAVDRKVTLAARSVADLISQAASVSTTDVNNILDAATAVTAPYSGTPLKVVVTQVKIDANNNATVDWSAAKGTGASARGAGSGVTVPDTLKVANTYLIMGEVSYAYTPVIGYVLTGTLNLHDQIFMRPRQSTSVTKTP
jgi:Flp pilus assembly protein TadG